MKESGKPLRSLSQEAVCWTESRLKSFRTVLGRRLQRQWSDQAHWWNTVTGGGSSRPRFSSAVTDNRSTGDQLEVEASLPYLPPMVVKALRRHFVGSCLAPGWNKHSWLPGQHS
ncbi:processing of precursor 5, ribonuclease P/MRP family (S. cerevisiae) (predicted), isoform CRA_b [Rattus norvegicus]|uniref:Processing of 5, ribonuclease P/MRP family (S. cerevisiae) (Predicted), isoform CRA_b n=1 Tax=Rattus norvegicus TaxID=10116 RepID=A6J1V9_RAT|nr:processing of precursor 5, ribonuclease P/MRP family (S. cerevisiae) (predicted), isoform CRA_b [Rattus norvegicus]